MADVKYEVIQLAPGQQCFGAGYWCIKRTTTETIAAAPTRGAAETFAEKMRKADSL